MDHIVGRNAGEIGAKSGKVRNGPDLLRTDEIPANYTVSGTTLHA
jgi:hypothetical protein